MKNDSQDEGASPSLRSPNLSGKMQVKEGPYTTPNGPKGQMREKPGNGGANHGNCGSQGRY